MELINNRENYILKNIFILYAIKHKLAKHKFKRPINVT